MIIKKTYVYIIKKGVDILKKIFAMLFFLCFILGFSMTNVYAEPLTNTAIQESQQIVAEAIHIETKLIDKNYNKEIKIVPEYIVIHETGNYNVGADSDAHYSFFNKDEEAKRSVHFVVDENTIVQLLPLDSMAWHVGDNKGHSDIKNINSIGIEICVNKDGDYEMARQRAIRLVKYLMNILNIDSQHVVRHFDASGKLCPATMLKYPELWNDFKLQIAKPDLIIDDFVPNMILSKVECHTVNYNAGNTILENKINFKRFNVDNFDYYIVKNYANKSWNFSFTSENSKVYELLNNWFKQSSIYLIDDNLYVKTITQ